MKRIQHITIHPGRVSHKIVFRYNRRFIVQYVQADIAVEAIQTWAESIYSKLGEAKCLKH